MGYKDHHKYAFGCSEDGFCNLLEFLDSRNLDQYFETDTEDLDLIYITEDPLDESVIEEIKSLDGMDYFYNKCFESSCTSKRLQ